MQDPPQHHSVPHLHSVPHPNEKRTVVSFGRQRQRHATLPAAPWLAIAALSRLPPRRITGTIFATRTAGRWGSRSTPGAPRPRGRAWRVNRESSRRQPPGVPATVRSRDVRSLFQPSRSRVANRSIGRSVNRCPGTLPGRRDAARPDRSLASRPGCGSQRSYPPWCHGTASTLPSAPIGIWRLPSTSNSHPASSGALIGGSCPLALRLWGRARPSRRQARLDASQMRGGK